MSWIQSDFQYTPPESYVPCEWSSGTGTTTGYANSNCGIAPFGVI